MSRLIKESNRLLLTLNRKERKSLQHILNRDCKPYRRERAAAILKIASGQSPHSVAKEGLLKERDPDTVYSWLKAFAQRGIDGLTQKERKRASGLSEKEKDEVKKIIQRKTPIDYGVEQSRWSLKSLLGLIPSLSRFYKSESGVWYLLKRLSLSYKRGRDSTHSPDTGKAFKIRRIRAYLGYARRHPDKVAFLFLDEFSFYRQPKVGPAWWPCGSGCQPPAIRSCTSDTRGRIVGAINAVSGELSFRIASSISVEVLCDFLSTLRQKYSHCEKIYLVLDNWHNVHDHPKTLATMKRLGITHLFLPTYCPESNPMEKLWQGLTRNVLKLHRLSDKFPVLKMHVENWLKQYLTPGRELLKMVGLLSGRAIPVDI
ncbi:MAG: IS630 family transposase [Candidatus Poribacteria bacterium]